MVYFLTSFQLKEVVYFRVKKNRFFRNMPYEKFARKHIGLWDIEPWTQYSRHLVKRVIITILIADRTLCSRDSIGFWRVFPKVVSFWQDSDKTIEHELSWKTILIFYSFF